MLTHHFLFFFSEVVPGASPLSKVLPLPLLTIPLWPFFACAQDGLDLGYAVAANSKAGEKPLPYPPPSPKCSFVPTHYL